MARTTVDYVEFPFDRTVAVHFGQRASTGLNVSWNAALLSFPDELEPFWFPGYHVMDVSVDNLPGLPKTHFEVGTAFVGTPPIPVSIDTDEVSGTFPDGTAGTISASAGMRGGTTLQPGGAVNYSTTAQGEQRFGGAKFISISIHVTLRDIFRSPGVHWTGSATFLGLSQNLSGDVAGGATLHFDAIAQINPPSLSFGAG